MASIHCGPDGSCPYQYYCQNDTCFHQPVFPIDPYPLVIYILFPIASAICNISGNSMGQFKVLLLMDALNYSQQESTVLCYPLIVGPALYNFLSLIPKRHPSKNTSIVDYNMVAIVLPSSLYGSIFGAIVNKLIPPIVADVIIILLLAFFSVRFFLKFRDLMVESKKKEQELPLMQGDNQDSQAESDAEVSIVRSLSVLSRQSAASQRRTSQLSQVKDTPNPYQDQLDKQLQYQSGYHLPHILAIIGGFILYEVLSVISQGKMFLHFNFCSKWYIIGVSLFTLFYALSLVGIYCFTKRELERYRRIGFEYNYPLDNLKYFAYIGIGSFTGGFIGGAFSLGNTTTIIFVLIYLEVEAMVVTATCGFQVVFSGAASLIESIARGESDMRVVGLFLGLTFVGGGILSFITHYFIDKLDKAKINKVLMLVIAGLTGVSTLSMVVNIVLSYISFGADYMIDIGPVCK